ncbi:hypothetical protein AB0L99_00240 [Streptomyces sp. NPDC051954]|uniref:hypothetical protein n=1 Tax=unclassified Streptomyces TaxID=2593676 RepID=UPI003443F2EE
MRKLQKAAVAAAIIGSFSFIATGTATAQSAHAMYGGGGCKSHDLNVDILGQVGLLNGLLGNAINGEGNAGGQHNHVGSSCGHGY